MMMLKKGVRPVVDCQSFQQPYEWRSPKDTQPLELLMDKQFFGLFKWSFQGNYLHFMLECTCVFYFPWDKTISWNHVRPEVCRTKPATFLSLNVERSKNSSASAEVLTLSNQSETVTRSLVYYDWINPCRHCNKWRLIGVNGIRAINFVLLRQFSINVDSDVDVCVTEDASSYFSSLFGVFFDDVQMATDIDPFKWNLCLGGHGSICCDSYKYTYWKKAVSTVRDHTNRPTNHKKSCIQAAINTSNDNERKNK
ncbi:hypothetical protein CLF_112532 [Clonorchis sinensis]|uniref:Uncharacterized protein n=1 Tax=Clonorchis sinensis TaxID=79923 RepID=G7YWJ5_CLOSI|nr:hypothetical protein CLF_112532 [Clonorchis sinensis]